MRLNITVTLALSAAILSAGGLGKASAQGCDALPASSEFAVEQIAVASGWPFDIVALKDGRVFWVERYGAFKVYNATTKAISTIKQFSPLTTNRTSYFGNVENGLEGMALDPNFESNHWVYIWLTLPLESASQHNLGPVQRLSRFTLKTNDTQLDEASEKVIFEQKIYSQCCHFGGAMKMTEDGTLYLSTGDNIHYNYTGAGGRAFDEANPWSDPRSTSSNTNDTRGKILRIKPIAFADAQTPTPGVGTTYTIPAGNLKETWDTPEKDKVRAEIYSMGHRNPFSISIHPDKPWVGIGEANGDINLTDGDDEINIVTKPGYYGWPFVIGANQNYIPSFWSGRNYNPSSFATTGITNDSRHNTGAKTLPPATGAVITVKHGGMNMPINCHGVVWGWVKYDPANPNKGKFPPYLKNKLLVSGYNIADVRVATVDESGKVTKLDEILFPKAFGTANGGFTTDVLRATQGADGAFYVGKGAGVTFPANNNCKIFKVSYKGDCSTVSTRPTQDQILKIVSGRRPITHFGSTEVSIPAGIRRVKAYDISGKNVWETSRASDEGIAMASIPASVPSGALKLRYFQN